MESSIDQPRWEAHGEMNESFREIVFADFTSMSRSKASPTWRRVLRLYLSQMAFRVVFEYRLGYLFRRKRLRFLGGWLDRRNWRRGVDICSLACIGKGLRIPHPHGIVIGGSVRIGSDARIQQGVTLGGNRGKTRTGEPQWTAPRLGDRVLIGPGAVIVGPVEIGDDVIVAANAVVTKDVPAGKIVGGVPARAIGHRHGQQEDLQKEGVCLEPQAPCGPGDHETREHGKATE
ncbi:MAG: serine O-acetyltransferase [Planctomycetota bacterium]